jgi:hypothetical protein
MLYLFLSLSPSLSLSCCALLFRLTLAKTLQSGPGRCWRWALWHSQTPRKAPRPWYVSDIISADVSIDCKILPGLYDSVGAPGMYVIFDNYQVKRAVRSLLNRRLLMTLQAYPEYIIEYS